MQTYSFVFVFLLFFGVEALVNPYGPTVVNDFTNCVNELIAFNFKEPGLIIFANTKNVSSSVARIYEELLKRINSNMKYTVQVKIPREEQTLCSQGDEERTVIHIESSEMISLADYFVVVVDTYEDFIDAATRIIRSKNWNPHAKIIVLLFNFASEDQQNKLLVENMLTCMFKQNAINMVVIVPQSNNIRNALVYSWRPLDPPKYCGYFNETAANRLLVEDTCEQGILKYSKHIFKGKVPKSMQGCVLEILTLQRQPFASGDPDDPNIERYFINQLADIYNLKTEYKIAGNIRGERNETSGDWNGAIKSLTNKKGHILLGGIFPDGDVHEDFECSNTYLADSYIWVAPKAFQSPKFQNLFIIFKTSVWYCVIAVFFLCVFSWKILGYLNKESLYHRAFGHCFLNTWISHVGFCAYARPVNDSLRVFYVFFNLYCILFLTGYQTKLIDVLKNPTFEEQIDTLEELVQSGLKFGGFEELHDLFLNSSDPFDYMLGEKWIDVENITQALIDVSVHRNFSVLCSRLELAHLSATIPQLSESSGAYKYFAFKENAFTVSVEMISLRGFAYISLFSDLLERFKQMGVNSGVRRYFQHLNLRKRARLLRELGEIPEVNSLTLEHLQGGFLALTLGYISGTLVLFFELIINTKYVKAKLSKFHTKRINRVRKPLIGNRPKIH